MDLISSLQLYEEPQGTVQVDGMCELRGDIAYRLKERIITSASTEQLYPRGFPRDFSILATFRPYPATPSATLLSVYSVTGEEQIVLTVGDEITLFYKDSDDEELNGTSVSFGANINDGE